MANRDNNRGGTNRDYGARDYGNVRSVTNRAWGDAPERDDAFGPPQLGGYGNFRASNELEHRGAGQGAAQDSRGGARRRGPRNATRPDSLIADELYHRFTDDDLLDASEILLNVEDGKVLLTGEVPERWMKHRAEDIADSIRGVRDIESRIRVDNGSASFGPGGAVRSGNNQLGSGFSSQAPNRDWQPPDNRVD